LLDVVGDVLDVLSVLADVGAGAVVVVFYSREGGLVGGFEGKERGNGRGEVRMRVRLTSSARGVAGVLGGGVVEVALVAHGEWFWFACFGCLVDSWLLSSYVVEAHVLGLREIELVKNRNALDIRS
jgi:hypothetical protein